jgi:hypothetical protein
MGAQWQYFDIDIPDYLGPEERELIGQEVLDFIRKRTEDGKTWQNREMAGYSEEYVKSLDFKIAGKSKNQVDLSLSGDMMGAMQVLDHKRGMLRIGFEKGSQENAKADGNIRGTYGKEKAVGPKRDFLGITKSDLDSILNSIDALDVAAQAAASRASRLGDE